MLRSRACSAPLGDFVASIWTSERSEGLAHAREWGLPTGRVDMVIPLDRESITRYAHGSDPAGSRFAGGVFQGVQQRPALRDTSAASIVVGAQLQFAGLEAFRREPASEYFAETLAMDDFWPDFSDALRERIAGEGALRNPRRRLDLFEQALLARLRPDARVDAFAAWASLRLAGGARVGDLQRECGLSAATAIARYRAACGIRPKQHAMIMRLQSALSASTHGEGWASIALASRYADQSHMTREFVRLTGLSPSQYRRGRAGFANHVVCR